MIPSTPPPCSEEGFPAAASLTDEQIAAIAKGLAHPARLRIIRQFEECRPHIAQDIVDESTLAQSTVSEHLRILREAEILFARRDGPKTWYCLRRSVLDDFGNAVQGLATRSRVRHLAAIGTEGPIGDRRSTK